MIIKKMRIITLLFIIICLVSQLLFLSEIVFSFDNQSIIKHIKKYHLNNIISTYTTYFNLSQSKRVCNIKLAIEEINGKVIMPQEVFSFNETVGARLKERGYQKATEIINGELVEGIGGGICQVSSTLYNTVLLADLKVTERRHHSQPVNYVPLGRGATVYYNQIDFKFKNNTGYPVMILAKVVNNQLTISLLGESKEEQIKIVTSKPEIISKEVIVKLDSSLPLGVKKVIQKGRDGIKIKVKKIISRGGRIIKTEDVSYDIYLPRRTIIKANLVK